MARDDEAREVAEAHEIEDTTVTAGGQQAWSAMRRAEPNDPAADGASSEDLRVLGWRDLPVDPSRNRR